MGVLGEALLNGHTLDLRVNLFGIIPETDKKASPFIIGSSLDMSSQFQECNYAWRGAASFDGDKDYVTNVLADKMHSDRRDYSSEKLGMEIRTSDPKRPGWFDRFVAMDSSSFLDDHHDGRSQAERTIYDHSAMWNHFGKAVGMSSDPLIFTKKFEGGCPIKDLELPFPQFVDHVQEVLKANDGRIHPETEVQKVSIMGSPIFS